MGDVRKELREVHGLDHVGWIRAGACPGGRCRAKHEPGHYHAYIERDIEKFAVYALIIGDQIMMVGKAGSGSGNSTLAHRMQGIASCGNELWLFDEGRPVSPFDWNVRGRDIFKQVITAVIRSRQEIEVYAGAFTASTFEQKKRELNVKYNPPWVQRHG